MRIVLFKIEYIFLLVIIGIFISFQVHSIFSESRVFDEGLHVEAGYAFLTKQDFAKEPFNPPLARELTALPSLIAPQTLSDPIFFWQRYVVVVVSCIFLLTLYLFTRKLFGVFAAMFAGVLYVFHPEILAHSHYAVTDLILSFFIFLSVMFYLVWQKNFTYKKSMLLGLCIGLALSSKISAVPFLLGTFTIFLLIRLYLSGLFTFFNKKGMLYFLVTCLSVLLSLWATYFFTTESVMGERFSPNSTLGKFMTSVPGVHYVLSEPIPLGGYLRTIKQIILYNYAPEYHKAAFLLGNFSQQGFWYFYPLAFVIKTPIPFMLFLLCMFLFGKKTNNLLLLVPVCAILFSSMLSTLNFGIRYILPIYPFLIVFVAPLITTKVTFPRKCIILTICLAWYIAGSLSEAPHFLPYMNEVTLGKQNRHHFLIDSNYDWGQGLVGLRDYQKHHNITNVQLAYFGMVNPNLYGLSYTPIGGISLGEKRSYAKLQIKQGSTIAIGASCYYFCGYYKMKVFKNKKPDTIVGGSIFIYQF